jgi:hypothetical protein
MGCSITDLWAWVEAPYEYKRLCGSKVESPALTARERAGQVTLIHPRSIRQPHAESAARVPRTPTWRSSRACTPASGQSRRPGGSCAIRGDRHRRPPIVFGSARWMLTPPGAA